MAGNRRVFEEAMRAAADAAWDESWGQAIEAYQCALAENPDDVTALTGLGRAYSAAGQLEAALDAYQRASDLGPEDSVLFERIGKTREHLGQRKEAADAYLASAECYLSQQQATDLAFERWKDAANASPRCTQARLHLLEYYQRRGQMHEAVEECLAAAQIYQRQGRNHYAVRLCQHALKLTPRDSEVLALLDDLLYGEQADADPSADLAEEGPEGLPPIERPVYRAGPVLQVPSEIGATQEHGGPVETTRERALTDLAESVFEEEEAAGRPAAPPRIGKQGIDALIGRAIDFQIRGRIEEATVAYEGLIEAGVERPAVHFNLGLLYQGKARLEDAVVQFERAVAYPDYRVGAHLASGECHRARGRIGEALAHFIEALKILDLGAARPEQADDLVRLYEHLAEGRFAKGDQDGASEFTHSLLTFLGGQGWEDDVVRARRQLDALTREGPPLSLAEMLFVRGSEEILESLALSQEYVGRGMFYAALEECYYALGQAPNYLPTHRHLAEVLLDMRKEDEAVAKFVAIADICWGRGNVPQAMAVYRHALELAPMDTAVRAKLVDLLASRGQVDEALEHYLILADSYHRLARMNQARQVYEDALQLATRSNREPRWAVRILHEMGDIDMQRVDWRRAVGVYERIRDLVPDDERARLTLMELYYRLNQPRLAIDELDSLLGIYRESGDSQRIFTILKEAVRRRPDSIGLRARLAQAYLNAGRTEQALDHLDELGELQLEAGRREDAKATVRAIIALRPPDATAYQELLDQLD